MNDFALSLVGSALRLTLFVAVALVVSAVARRWGPEAGARATLASLLVALAVSVLHWAPWPRWWAFGPSAFAAARAREPAAHEAGNGAAAAAPDAFPHAADSDGSGRGPRRVAAVGHGGLAADFVQAFAQELMAGGRARGGEAARWPSVAAVLIGLSVALGVARLACGLWAVHRYRVRSRPVHDAGLLELVAELAVRTGCRRTIEARESADMATAATMGWRRPLLLLPAAWHDWSELERRVVLAHEIAHVARRDYLAWLGAQLSVALHFYHPLVHWLAARLRLEQELAADARGAELAGGRRTYLMTLAQLALRQQDDRPISLAARTFLPTRGTFLRRIEMLRSAQNLTRERFSRVAATTAVTLLMAGGVLVAGLRGVPAARASLSALPGSAADDKTPIDLSYVPTDAAVVVAARPAALLAKPGMDPVAKAIREISGGGQPAGATPQDAWRHSWNDFLVGVPIEQIEQLTLVVLPNTGNPPGTFGRIVRSTEPRDWKKLVSDLGYQPVEAKHAGQMYYKLSSGPQPMLAFFTPDDRTIVFDTEQNLYRYIARGKGRLADYPWADAWSAIAHGQLAAAIDAGWVRSQIEAELKQAPRGPGAIPIATFAPLWEETRFAVAGLDLGNGLAVDLRARCGDEAGAKRVAATAQAVLTLAANAAETLRQQADSAPPDLQLPLRQIKGLFGDLLKNARVEQDGALVRAHTQADFDVARTVQMMLPAVQAARGAAQQSQSRNNMKQIGLAIHNYNDVYAHLPAAIGYGSDGKTPHSWRVDLLPYLEQAALYREYNFNEPWDGPNNRKLLDKMPAVYRAPASDSRSSTSYVVPTGPVTLFADAHGTKFSEVTDGTSNTLMALEVKPTIPWTKPEDLPYDPAQPLPELGGVRPNGFLGLLADGSVRFFTQPLDPSILRALLTKAGGEVVNFP